jgi:hypothetical protein
MIRRLESQGIIILIIIINKSEYFMDVEGTRNYQDYIKVYIDFENKNR